MVFAKGDPRINRGGRPKNAEPDMLRKALEREGQKRGVDFWTVVAEHAFKNPKVLVAIVKKFVPDMTVTDLNAEVFLNSLPQIMLNNKELEYKFDAANGAGNVEDSGEADADNN
jgi:hypothetical protein